MCCSTDFHLLFCLFFGVHASVVINTKCTKGGYLGYQNLEIEDKAVIILIRLWKSS